MKARRLSIFLPRPTDFYVGVLRQMKRGFSQAGFEVAGATQLLDEIQMAQWCDEHRPDVIFEMNRPGSEVPFIPKGVRHISWIVDLKGRSMEELGGSDITYFFDDGWRYSFPFDTLSDWLPPGTSPDYYYPEPGSFSSTVSFVGHASKDWSQQERDRNVSRCDSTPLPFSDFLPELILARSRNPPLNSQDVLAQANDIVLEKTGSPLRDDESLRYDIVSRIPRMVRKEVVQEAARSYDDIRIFGSENWCSWPELAPLYRGSLREPDELRRVYATSRINLHEGVGMHFRSLDCMASGGLLFAVSPSTVPIKKLKGRSFPDGKDPDSVVNRCTLCETFCPGKHYVEYALGEFADVARFFLARPDMCNKIREAAAEAIAEHTWRHRAMKVTEDLARL